MIDLFEKPGILFSRVEKSLWRLTGVTSVDCLVVPIGSGGCCKILGLILQ
jgi:hypothetical protein